MTPIARVLTFAPRDAETGTRDKDIFDIIWLALMFLPLPVKGRAGIKQAKRVRQSFREISERIGADSEADELTLSEQGGDVALSDEDHKWLLKQIEGVSWKGGNVEAVANTYEFFDSTKRVSSADVVKAARGDKVISISRPTEPRAAEG